MTSPRARVHGRRALRDLSDGALIDGMRSGAPEAWQEFMMRFRPLLLRYGTRMRMDAADWSTCVDVVLEEAAMRWAVDGAVLPKSMAAYLLRAATYRRRTLERDARRRARRHEIASHTADGEGVVLSLCSEAAVRDSYGPAANPEPESRGALARFWTLLQEPLTDDERTILARLGDGLPHREIASELGVGYETGRKRIQRLCARVRALVPGALERLSAADRHEVERFLLRLRPERARGADDVV